MKITDEAYTTLNARIQCLAAAVVDLADTVEKIYTHEKLSQARRDASEVFELCGGPMLAKSNPFGTFDKHTDKR
jgi:hypothetical protein